MNLSSIWHGFLAVLISCIAYLLAILFNPIAICLLAGALFFLGREFFTAELRIKEKLNLDEITPKCTLQALKIWQWDKDTLFDFLVPLACCVGLILCFEK